MMVERIARLALILLLVSLACSLPALPQDTSVPPAEVTAVAAGPSFLQAPPNATATATPFQPFGPTATLSPSRIPNPTATFAPLEEEEEDVPAAPTPVRVTQKVPPGTVTFMVLGNDFRPGGGYRTDVMMLVAVHTGSGRVSVVSIPRDLYVTIPGWADQRINTAFPRGGITMLADTLEYNFGVRPSFYVMTNFQGFVSIINSLGGVNVYAGAFLSDSCDLPQAVGGRCTVYAGPVAMDGATALWYVRSRYTSSDLDRLRRAQEVMYAMFVKLMNLNAVGRLPELYTSYRSSVETNINVEDLLPLLPVASQVIGDSSRLQRYSIGAGMVTNYITESGGQVLLPNHAAIQQMFAEAVFTE